MFGDPSTNPMGWNEGTVRDIVTEVKYGTSKPAIDGGKYKYLRMNNITYNGELDISDLKYIDIPEKDIEKCIVRKGVLYGMCKAIVGQANINAQELQDIKLFISPIELQKQYVEFLTQVDKLKFEMENSLK